MKMGGRIVIAVRASFGNIGPTSPEFHAVFPNKIVLASDVAVQFLNTECIGADEKLSKLLAFQMAQLRTCCKKSSRIPCC